VSDVHLRELERRWAATRAIADEVALVSARLRAGTITRERLELAAYCANAAAVEILGPTSRGDPSQDGWLRTLKRFGNEAVLRHDVTWLGCFLPLWDELSPADPHCGDLVAAVEDFVACPCPLHAAAAGRLAVVPSRHLDLERAITACHEHNRLHKPYECVHPVHLVLDTARTLAQIAAGVPDVAPILETGSVLRFGLRYRRPGERPDLAPHGPVVDDLAAWALGHDDALRARVAARAAMREAAEGCTTPPLVPSAEAAAALRAAEARAKVRPGDLPTLVDLVHRSEQAGWTHDGRPISELRAALAEVGGTHEQDRRLAALLTPLGGRAVPLALEALERHRGRAAFLVLELLGPRAAAAVPVLLELLGHADGSVRIRAGQVLAAIGKAAVSPLRLRLPELSHPGGAVFALLALAEGPWTVEGPLLHAFNQNDEATWSLLFELPRPGALAPAAPALRALVQSPLCAPAVRARCEVLLHELEGQGLR
jgi:hypothetical protein